MQPTTGYMTAGPTQQTVVVQGAPAPRPPVLVQSESINRQAVGLGIVQLILGVLCFFFNIAAICIGAVASYGASGIWCGIMFIITGPFGIVAGKKRVRSWYIAYMVLSIISAALTLFVVSQSAAGLAVASNSEVWVYDCYYINSDHGYWNGCYKTDPQRSAKLFLHASMFIMGLLEAIFFIWASILCCSAVCCKTGQVNTLPGQTVVYHAGTQPMVQPGQQVMMVNQAQPQIMYTTIPAPQQQQYVMMPSQAQAPPVYTQGGYPPQNTTPNPPQQLPENSPPSGEVKQAL